jgi:predicted kinase
VQPARTVTLEGGSLAAAAAVVVVDAGWAEAAWRDDAYRKIAKSRTAAFLFVCARSRATCILSTAAIKTRSDFLAA